MSKDVKNALSSLIPIGYNTIDLSGLNSFFRTTFQDAELAINSIPPAAAASHLAVSEPSTPNSARKATDTACSPINNPLDARNADLQKTWGKPVKNPAKENLLNIAVYKTAAADKHGAWFARRSIHQGLGYEKWKRCMQREFGESSKTNGVGKGAIRGIAADRRVEKHEIEGVGKMEVWHLSAQFPGPTAPREFLEILLTSDDALSEASAIDSSSKKPPRHFMVVSRPTTHSGAGPRNGLVRGTYESIEMIRELPGGHKDDPEMNPIEWIMITRSDPGGGIPKFMVERGTPESIVGDTTKFLDWACKQPDITAENDDDHEAKIEESSKQAEDTQQPVGHAVTDGSSADYIGASGAAEGENAGIIASVTAAVGATAASLITALEGKNEDDDDSSPSETDDEEDDDYFTSADEGDTPASTRSIKDGRTRAFSSGTTSTGSDNSGHQSISAALANGKEPSNHHEKELVKMHKKRAQLEEKLGQPQSTDDLKSIEEIKADAGAGKQQQALAKAQEKKEKEKVKQDRKVKRDLEKLDQKHAKEEKKAEESARKAAEKDALTKALRERDEARELARTVQKETEILRKQVATLEGEKADLLS